MRFIIASCLGAVIGAFTIMVIWDHRPISCTTGHTMPVLDKPIPKGGTWM
jgi:hypothetical protein